MVFLCDLPIHIVGKYTNIEPETKLQKMNLHLTFYLVFLTLIKYYNHSHKNCIINSNQPTSHYIIYRNASK